MRNPAFFRGRKKRKHYFEGWCFKCISRDRNNAIALIPGMAVAPDGTKHCFVQVINASGGKLRTPVDGLMDRTSKKATRSRRFFVHK